MGGRSSRCTGLSRRPVSASAGNSATDTSWAMSTPGIRASAAWTSWDCTERPNGHPVPSGPPVSGSKSPYSARSTSSCTSSASKRSRALHVDDHGEPRVVRRCHQHPGADQAALVQGVGDPLQHALVRDEVAPGGSARRRRRRRAARRAPARPRLVALAAGRAVDPGGLGGDVARQLDEVLGGDSATSGPQQHAARGPWRRRASPRRHPPTAGGPVLHAGDVRHARLQHPHLAGR